MKKCVSLLLIILLLTGAAGCGADASQSGTVSPAGSSADSSTGSSADSPVDVSVKTVSEGDMEMDYIVFGTGEKNFVILPGISIHSVMGSAEAVAAAYEAFTEKYTVYLFDRVKDMPDGYGIEDMANDTAAAMKTLNIENADVFGVSQGGMIALYLAIDHPELVNKMILGSTLAKPNDTAAKVIGEWIKLAEAKDETALLESFADTVYSEATLEAYRDTLISSNLGITDEEYSRFLIQAKACLSFDCYDRLSSIQCPVLVLGSDGDRVVTAEASTQIAEALNCEIYLYDDSYGHAVYDEAADYKQRCLDFLED